MVLGGIQMKGTIIDASKLHKILKGGGPVGINLFELVNSENWDDVLSVFSMVCWIEE